MMDKEADLFVLAFKSSPPSGFTEAEKRQILNWLKSPSVFMEAAERKIRLGGICDPPGTSYWDDPKDDKTFLK